MLYQSNGVKTHDMRTVAPEGQEWAFLMNYEPTTLDSKEYAKNEEYKLNQAPYFIAGLLKENIRRDDNLLEKRLVALDFEELNMTLEEFQEEIHKVFHKVDYILYPTIHCFNKGESKGFRYRLVLNTDRSYTREENEAIYRALYKRLKKIPFDPASGIYSQLMGLPILTPHTNKDMIIKNDGVPLPITELVKHAPKPGRKHKTFKGVQLPRSPQANYTQQTLREFMQGAEPGERNVKLTSFVGRLFYIGLKAEEVYTWIQVINENFINPPLPDHELNTLFASILKSEIRKKGGTVKDDE